MEFVKVRYLNIPVKMVKRPVLQKCQDQLISTNSPVSLKTHVIIIVPMIFADMISILNIERD